jgi:hypothetical protein
MPMRPSERRSILHPDGRVTKLELSNPAQRVRCAVRKRQECREVGGREGGTPRLWAVGPPLRVEVHRRWLEDTVKRVDAKHIERLPTPLVCVACPPHSRLQHALPLVHQL